MRQLADISKELESMGTVVELTSAFEGISSMRISQIKDQTQSSERFFADLWQIYTQIRVDELFHFGRRQSIQQVIAKELLVLITSDGSFSGDVDQKLIAEVMKYYVPDKNDIIVVGRHGAQQLTQRSIIFKRSFKLPEKDQNINAEPIIDEVQKYKSTVVFYTAYKSLMVQDVKSIKLQTAVAERGRNVRIGEEDITESNYIFEPSTYAVIDHLERSMMQITISEVILESKLAQYASRFKAMSSAHQKADETHADLKVAFARAKRSLKDERLKEVVVGARMAKE